MLIDRRSDSSGALLGIETESLRATWKPNSRLRRDGQPIEFARYRHRVANIGMINTPASDMVLAAFATLPLYATDVFRNGRYERRPESRAGSLSLYDLRESWVSDVHSPIDNVCIYLPLRVFKEYAADRGLIFVEMHYRVEEVVYDKVIGSIAREVTSAMEGPTSNIDFERISLTVRDHIAATYGVFSGRGKGNQRHLTTRQLHSAVEFIEDNLGEDILLSHIASASGASISSLTRGFRLELRVSPHQWIVNRRIVLAQRLMRRTHKSLSEIAASCGFVDQSHFSRVFANYVGTPPATWRRKIRR